MQWTPCTRNMKRKLSIVLLALIGVCLLALPASIIIVWTRPPAAPLPSPNGYNDFVKAGRMLPDEAIGGYRELGYDELRDLVSTNSEAVAMLRVGLSRACRVPPIYSREQFRNHIGERRGLIRLAWALAAEGRLATLDGRTNDAVKTYLHLIRFAHESARGGLIPDAIGTRGGETLGLAGLRKLQDTLDASQSRQIAKTLEEVNTRRQPWSEFSRRDAAYMLRAELMALFSPEFLEAIKHHQARFLETEKQRRQTMTDFAARAYELEKGHRPTSLADLVPDYLRAIPTNPLTGTNMVFTP